MFDDASRQKRNAPGLDQRKAIAFNKGRRRSIFLKVRLGREIIEGMTFVPFCFSEASANILTNPKVDPVAKIPELKFCAPRIKNQSNASQSTANSIHYLGSEKGPIHSSTEEEANA